MTLKRPLAAAALAVAIAMPATHAVADDKHRIYLNASAGWQKFDHKLGVDKAATYGLGFEYRMLPRWAAELGYQKGNASNRNASGSNDFKDYRLDGIHYFAGPREAWNPYLAAGIGRIDFDGYDDTRLNVGGGLRYNVSDMISLRGDLREFYRVDEDQFDTVVSLGISLVFARTPTRAQPEPAPRPAPAPAPAPEPEPEPEPVVEAAPPTPAAPPAPRTIETFTLAIQFPTNSSVIDNRYDGELRRVADFLAENPGTTVEVAGHSDNIGDPNYNQFLSQRRAEAVAARLVDVLGVESGRVSSRGYGEAEPIASNDTAAGRAQNRRVEARIQAP